MSALFQLVLQSSYALLKHLSCKFDTLCNPVVFLDLFEPIIIIAIVKLVTVIADIIKIF